MPPTYASCVTFAVVASAVPSTVPPAQHGVHSEVGRLRKVLVCAPGLAHERLTPTNSDDLLFDDVMWVENAQRDHADVVSVQMFVPLETGLKKTIEYFDRLLGSNAIAAEARSVI